MKIFIVFNIFTKSPERLGKDGILYSSNRATPFNTRSAAKAAMKRKLKHAEKHGYLSGGSESAWHPGYQKLICVTSEGKKARR